MQTLTLKVLTRDGEIDPDIDKSISVTYTDYIKFPTLKNEDLGKCIIEKSTFKEIYRGHFYNDNAKHTSLIIKTSEDDTMPWNIVWLEKISLWIAFRYSNIVDPSEAYGSTVEVAEPIRGDVYKINQYVAELLRQAYNIKAPLTRVYCSAPNF